MSQYYFKSLAFALLIAAHGYLRGSLKLSGAISAALVGYLTLGNPEVAFGAALLSFYIIGDIATKYKRSFKATLVDEGNVNVETNSKKCAINSGRDWKQVLCNSWLGMLCAVGFRFQKLLSNGLHSPSEELLSRSLVCTALAFWSGCAGDTLGILSRSHPRLITTLKKVPPGTNGAVSWLGLGFSAIGGILVGVSCVLLSHSLQPKVPLVIGSGICGLTCSIVDSILGATFQQTLYLKKDMRVVSRKVTKSEEKKDLIVVRGLNLMNNNQVCRHGHGIYHQSY
ncbi:integral membrane protein DUF92-domain-containing protein [Phakopsora pachyrhizi]|nr:integral membrane protein DUF92-domain-containing protein [Phakopsora pachyrhizi]